MKKYLLKMTLLLSVIIAFTSINCKKEVTEDPFLKVENINFTKEKSIRKISVSTNVVSWTVSTPSDSWLKVKKQGNEIEISVEENKGISRNAKFSVQGGGLSVEVKVNQIGTTPDIIMDKDFFKLEKLANEFSVLINANVPYEIAYPDWIAEKSKENVGNDIKYNLRVGENPTTSSRDGVITLSSKGINPTIRKYIQVIQKGEYKNDNVNYVAGDIKVTIQRGTTTSQQNGTPIENSYDGNMSTIYHSNWTNSSPNYFPITIEYFFENPQDVDYMMYYPRTEGYNGHFKQVLIQVSTENEPNYRDVIDFDFKGNGKATRVNFNHISGAKSFKLIVKSGHGDQGGFASASEIEFWKKNTDDFDPTSIFTDNTCSELKAGVTDQDIQNITNPFYRNIAQYMKFNQYPSEFRIQEYRAWPNPEYYRELYRMQYSYSNLDNPTGISTEEGEELIVMVGPTHGKDIQIKIQNLDKPNGDGFDNASYHPLYEGINKIRSGKSGLIYLQYQTNDYVSAPKIKVHFATGSVNGYFDKTKHTDADWNRLINNATNKYFDVVGEKAHLCFPVESYKTYTGYRGKELIEQFDKLIEQTHIFAGLTKERNKELPNRSYFQVMYKGFMYCTSNRTSYNVSTMSTLCDPDKMGKASDKTKTELWGPAHEVGHAHQVRPVFMWIGMTECTVNMNSLNVQTAWGIPTRLERESMQSEGGYNNRYEKAFNIGIVPKKAHGDFGDVFCQLVPFWQLNLYFSLAKENPNFSIELYDKMREIQLKPTIKDGEYQVDFTKTVSELTGTNLTNFFEKWGFYTPIDKSVNDYSTRQLTVTDVYANQIKNQINSKGLQNITDRIEYITDTNWQYFKNKSTIVKGTASKNGRRIETLGWQNVVAYEVYEGNNLVFVSPKNSFTLKNDFTNNTHVYAIQYDGVKIEVVF